MRIDNCLNDFSKTESNQSGLGGDSLDILTQVESKTDQGNSTTDLSEFEQFSNTMTSIDENASCEFVYEAMRGQIQDIFLTSGLENLIKRDYSTEMDDPRRVSYNSERDPFEHLDNYRIFSEEGEPTKPLLTPKERDKFLPELRAFPRRDINFSIKPFLRNELPIISLEEPYPRDPKFQIISLLERKIHDLGLNTRGQEERIPNRETYFRPEPLPRGPILPTREAIPKESIDLPGVQYPLGAKPFDDLNLCLNEGKGGAKRPLTLNTALRNTEGELTQFDGEDGFYSNLNGLEKKYNPDGLSRKIFNRVKESEKNQPTFEIDAFLELLLSGKSNPEK